MGKVLVQNDNFCLTIGENCVAESLVYKPTGEECLKKGEEIALFSVTEDRPYNNEIKLAHPNKRMTFQANRVRREGNKLIVGFELVEWEAVVEIKETANYISFKLSDFIVAKEHIGGLTMDFPPVAEFRLIQLPVANRERFGEWLNVFWDDKVAINVLATSPYARIDSEKRKDFRIMSADAVRGIKLKGCEAALIVNAPEKLLDNIEGLEKDFNLPNGVKSRRADTINASAYWTPDITPATVDEHIAYAKKGGFRMMLIYYTAFCKVLRGYGTCGDYDFNEHYPNGMEDLKNMLEKIKAAGITPGIHFLQTHIGIVSRYVTPVADHRLNLTRHFTLAKPLGIDDDTIYVEQNPEGAVMYEACRVLQFGGELISYESYSEEWPYCFKGCKRGHWDTNVVSHDKGVIGGLVDVSEYGATSVYLDQNTSLQDEVADKLAKIYNLGFEFVYFDGSEGTNPPFEFHVPNAQYRVYKKLDKEPLYCEGAAKAHFSWHMLSGGNAFDVFKTEIFKACIAKYPLEEAGRMANDFTRLNFGWWGYYEDTQPDIYEYGTSRAAAWNCPVTMMENFERFNANARTADNLEVMRRWEDVRAKKLLTDEQKEQLKVADKEHTLLINEKGEYELVEYEEIKEVAGGAVSAFVFERAGKNYVVCWHKTGKGKLSLKLDVSDFVYENEIGGEKAAAEKDGDKLVIEVEGKKYLSTTLSKDELVCAFKNAVIL